MCLEKLKNNIKHGGERSQELGKQMPYDNNPEKSQNKSLDLEEKSEPKMMHQ